MDKVDNKFDNNYEDWAVSLFIEIFGVSGSYKKHVDTKYKSNIDLVIDEKGYEFVIGDPSDQIKKFKVFKSLIESKTIMLDKQMAKLLYDENLCRNVYQSDDLNFFITCRIYTKEFQLSKHFKRFNNLNLVIYFVDYSPATFQMKQPILFLDIFEKNIIVQTYLTGVYLIFLDGIFYYDKSKNNLKFMKNPNLIEF